MRKLVLWGHDLDEYREMFELSDAQLSAKLLELGSGPTAVNGQLTQLGGHITSCDQLFSKDINELKKHVNDEFNFMMEEIRQDQSMFNWDAYGSIDNFFAKRRQGIESFFCDYNQDLEQKRYQAITDDQLPFDDFQFDLAFCSHYLFANIDNQDVEHHVNVIKEMCRVAQEARIFPLIDRFTNVSELLGPVLLQLQQANFGVEVKQVNYSLQEKGNAMLRVWPLQCEVNS